MTIAVLGHHYIGGRRIATGVPALRSYDARTGDFHPIAFYEATSGDVGAAAQAAQEAFPIYSGLSAAVRAAFLEAIANEIDGLGPEFITEVSRETALPATRLEGEQKRTTSQLRLFANALRRGDFYGARIDRAMPERKPIARVDLRQYRIGVGPVAVFGASNFPLAFSVAGGDTASALAAGCTVVVKAHPSHMVTSEHVANAIERAIAKTNMPAGTFNMIYGAHAGALLVQAPQMKAVGFTGSLIGGRALFDLVQSRPEPIPVFAEMSSVNPVFVMASALEQRGHEIAVELAASVTLGCGQFCTNPGLVLGLRSPAFDRFLQDLSKAMAAVPPQTMLSSGTCGNFREGLARLRALEGVEILTASEGNGGIGGHLLIAERDALFDIERALEEEVFGPLTVVVALDNEADMLEFARSMRGQLTATLLCANSDLPTHMPLIRLLEQKAGRLLFNGYPTGVEVSDAMVHGGPYPATTDARGTSVGTMAIERFLRPVCFQNYPDNCLPAALQDANPLNLLRLVDGTPTRDRICAAIDEETVA
jgi:NADP-dependent aldehyde dehydrogenase